MERTFSFVDLAGFTALTEIHGDETAADLVEHFTDVVDGALGEDGARVQTIGDAVFLVSREPSAALSVLKRVWQRADEEHQFPALRAGVHHGSATQRGKQFYGTAVNVAARVAAQAAGGQVLGTALVAAAARKDGLTVRSMGRVALKNLRGPIDLFDVGLGAAIPDAIDPVCRMRVTQGEMSVHLELEGQAFWFCSRACLEAFLKEERP